MNALAPALRPGLSFSLAPRETPVQAVNRPESDGIFMPEIRPDSGCCQSPVMSGLAGCTHRKAVRRSCTRFLRPRQFPAPRRFVLELLGD